MISVNFVTTNEKIYFLFNYLVATKEKINSNRNTRQSISFLNKGHCRQVLKGCLRKYLPPVEANLYAAKWKSETHELHLFFQKSWKPPRKTRGPMNEGKYISL